MPCCSLLPVHCFACASGQLRRLHKRRVRFSTYHSERSSSSVGYNAGAGIVLDTNVSESSLIIACISATTRDRSGSKFFGRYSMHRASFINTFGFHIVGNKQARIWLGRRPVFHVSSVPVGYDPAFVIIHAARLWHKSQCRR